MQDKIIPIVGLAIVAVYWGLILFVLKHYNTKQQQPIDLEIEYDLQGIEQRGNVFYLNYKLKQHKMIKVKKKTSVTKDTIEERVILSDSENEIQIERGESGTVIIKAGTMDPYDGFTLQSRIEMEHDDFHFFLEVINSLQ